MRQDARRAVAYIAGRAISGRNVSSIFDYEAGAHTFFTGPVAPYRTQVFDHTAGCYITGSGDFSNLSLFHYGLGSHIKLSISGNEFRGFDFGGGSHFSGNVNFSTVSIHDYGTGSYYRYTV